MDTVVALDCGKVNMKLTTSVLKVGVPTANGHVYEDSVIQAVVEQLKGTELIGYMGMPQPTIRAGMEEASHTATNFRVDGQDLLADISTLDTPKGQELASLLVLMCESGMLLGEVGSFGFRPAGMGVLEQRDGALFVTDYTLMNVNAVTDCA